MRENLFKAICFLFFVLILIINNSYAKTNPTFNTFHLDIFNRKITIKAENVNFKDILKELEKKTNIKIYISKEIFDKKVSIDIKNLPFYAIGNLLEKIDINDYVVLYDNKTDLYEIYISYPNKEIKKLIQNKSVIKKSNFLNGVNDKTVKGLEIETTIHDKNSYQIRLVKDEILLKFNKKVTNEQIKEILKKYNFASVEDNEISKIGYVKVKIAKGKNITSIIKDLKKEQTINVSEPNYIINILTISDPIYKDQTYIPDTNFDKVWNEMKNKNIVKVAVIDTGVDTKHSELKNKILKGYDFVNEDNDPMDDNGHGTFVSGIIVAASNDIGIKGLYDSAKILPIKVIDKNGIGTYEDVARGIIYATDNSAKVINLSIGGYAYSSLLRDAIDYALLRGSVIVAAGGNDGIEKEIYPASYPDVIGVSAIESNEDIWKNSNKGKHIDVCAPGVEIISTGLYGEYIYASGTSASAGMVSALAAMLVSEKPELSNLAIVNQIMKSAKDLGAKGRDNIYGNGKIDALAALKYKTINKDIEIFKEIKLKEIMVLVKNDTGEVGYFAPKWSPNGKYVAYTKKNYKGIYLVNYDANEMKAITEDESAGFRFIWSPDSKEIIYRSKIIQNDETFFIIKSTNIDDLNTIELTPKVNWVSIPAFINNKDILYSNNNILKIRKRDQNSNWYYKEEIIANNISANAIIEIPSTNKVVIEDMEGIKIVDLNDKIKIKIIVKHGQNDLACDAKMSLDLKKIMFFNNVGPIGHLFVYNIETEKIIDIGEGSFGQWLPNNKILYYITKDDGYVITESDIYTINYDGSDKKKITNTENQIELQPAVSLNGELITYRDNISGNIILGTIEGRE